MTSRPRATVAQEPLAHHLDWWGLRRFESDDSYFQWQREALSPQNLATLNRLVEQKRAPRAGIAAETAFYDYAARPDVLPVLYSQQYDYYQAVGPAVAERLGGAGSILDFGCGIGLMTTFYARQFPAVSVVGVDRSDASLAVARERARALGLGNLRFECLDVQHSPLSGTYDLIIATHSLVQSEEDPGLPSLNWQTFERRKDPAAEADFEQRTGLKTRLDHLCQAMAPAGRLIAFEKTRQLARRVPFQRALAARGLRLLEPPVPIRYRVVEEVADDGPLYVLTCAPGSGGSHVSLEWDENPEQHAEAESYRRRGDAAIAVWKQLPDRVATRESDWIDLRFGPVRAEWGRAGGGLVYLYITVGDRFRGILVSGREAGIELTHRVGEALRETGVDSVRFETLLDATWPAVTEQEDPTHTPLYENHLDSAQQVWSRLPERRVVKESTYEEPDGRQKHVELGTTPGLVYLYWANTFDQRQLVMVERQRASLLEDYYQELLHSGGQGSRDGRDKP
ncbi:MAG: class I SAM-dependent methyltransferase [Nitrospiraceae bacterium]